MTKPPEPDFEAEYRLDQISTRWTIIRDPVRFVKRYDAAIQRYLKALIKNPHDAEEVAQDFQLRMYQHGLVRSKVIRGRFRNYLKAAVRNAALTYFRRRPHERPGDLDLLHLPDHRSPGQDDQEWLDEWRRCLLDRTWEALERHQRRSPGNLFHTVLRVAVDQPHDDSRVLAARVSALTGNPISAEAFRKQLSRARRKFAGLVVREVAQTLENPTLDHVEEELIELRLMKYVQDYLPPDWRVRGILIEPE